MREVQQGKRLQPDAAEIEQLRSSLSEAEQVNLGSSSSLGHDAPAMRLSC